MQKLAIRIGFYSVECSRLSFEFFTHPTDMSPLCDPAAINMHHSPPTINKRFLAPPWNVSPLKSTIRPKKVLSRKLRKSCSLETCTQEPGECMHCTCNGRCGQHEYGKCGVRREGSGKNCKRPNCSKDDKCLHSTRATCCHCRNLVSSQSRGLRTKRARRQMDAKSIKIPAEKRICTKYIAPIESKSPVLSKLIVDVDMLQPFQEFGKDTARSTAVPSLVEYPQWNNRRHCVNLIVMIENQPFLLHKYPILLQSPVLKRLARQEGNQMAFIRLDQFPGGAEAFELACIYAYTLCVESWSPRHAALLYHAARALEMTVDCVWKDAAGSFNLKQHSRLVCVDLIEFGSETQVVDLLLEMDPVNQEEMVSRAVSRLAKAYPYGASTMVELQRLPCEIFLRITQTILCQGTYATNAIAMLCGQAHLAQVFLSKCGAHQKATVMIRILQDLLGKESQSATTAELVLKVASDMGVKLTNCGRLTSLEEDNTGRILLQAMTMACK